MALGTIRRRLDVRPGPLLTDEVIREAAFHAAMQDLMIDEGRDE